MERMEKIEIQYHGDADPIEKLSVGDWIDLRAAEDVEIPLNGFALISLGVSMKLPEGYEAHIVPRSSTFKNWGIIQTNHTGIIDNSYCGTNDIWKVPVYCLEEKCYITDPHDPKAVMFGTRIYKGDRICQFRIVKKQPPIEFEVVEKLSDTDRGGFGSTGSN